MQELAQRYGLDWRDEVGRQHAVSLLAMVGGHPYLVSLALYHLCWKQMTLEELLQAAPTTAGIYSHYLRSHLTILKEQPQLATALRQVVNAAQSVQLDAIAAYKLESMGLIQLDGNRAEVSCELYRLYFRTQLGAENSIDAAIEQLQPGQQELQCKGSIDELTHLASQRYFNQYLEAKWQQWAREASELSLILCEIDQNEFFNDAQGRSAGDDCLQLIASTICDCVWERVAFVARYGSKQFAVVLPRTDAEIAVAIAQNIRESVRALAIEPNYSRVGGFPAFGITVSLGVAHTTPSGTSAAMLVAAAVDALEQAKRLGCDRVPITSTQNLAFK